jgi:multisubunit Na+/H+ antiporter MnhB subunit
MMATALDVMLVLLLVGSAISIIAARTAFTAIVMFFTYGLLLSIAWVELFAIDVALTEAAIGSGLTGMLLLGAAAKLPTASPASSGGRVFSVVTGVMCASISVGLIIVLWMPPDGTVTLAPEVMAHLPPSGLGNPVAGVLFIYRAFDTMLEKVVLVLALLGVWLLSADRFWGGMPGPDIDARPNGILVFMAQLLPPFGLLVGIYMFWAGASQPGGAFQGGTVLAAMWILTIIAGSLRPPRTGSRVVRLLVVAGPAIFLAIGLAGFVVADAFLAYPAGYAKPLIIVIEAALTLSIAVTLGLVALGPPQRMPQE